MSVADDHQWIDIDEPLVKLRPCPFCGDTAVMTEEGREFMIGCGGKTCEAYVVVGPYRTEKEAVQAWNHRA